MTNTGSYGKPFAKLEDTNGGKPEFDRTPAGKIVASPLDHFADDRVPGSRDLRGIVNDERNASGSEPRRIGRRVSH